MAAGKAAFSPRSKNGQADNRIRAKIVFMGRPPGHSVFSFIIPRKGSFGKEKSAKKSETKTKKLAILRILGYYRE